MKTTIKTLAAAVLAGVFSIANVKAADTGKPFAVGMYQVTNSLSMRLAINKSSDAKVNITLKDDKGNVLYSTQIAKNENAFRCNVDMSQLTDGKYQFSVSDGTTTETKEVVIATKKAEPVTELRFISMN